MLLDPHYCIYVAVPNFDGNAGCRLGITHNPSIDAGLSRLYGYNQIFVIFAGLPLALADYAVAAAFGRGACRQGPLNLVDPLHKPGGINLHRRSFNPHHRLSRIARRLVTPLHRIGYGGYRHWCGLRVVEALTADAPVDGLPGGGSALEGLVRGVLDGRILFRWELMRALKENGVTQWAAVEDILQALWLRGEVARLPAVEIGLDGIPRCNRCGGVGDVMRGVCASCGDDACLVCLECASMGEARGCRALYSGVGAGPQPCPEPSSQPSLRSGLQPEQRLEMKPQLEGLKKLQPQVQRLQQESQPQTRSANDARRLHLDFELTPAQKAASRAIVELLLSTPALIRTSTPGPAPARTTQARRECLIWAACGSGKTEVSFAAIDETLARGGRVLFAIPRRDVVMELEPRLRSAFPGVDVAVLYGAAGERYGRARITIATTHQVIRFYHAFDLIILDEFDAFPYRGSRMLQYAMRRAVRDDGFTMLMSATPDAGARLRARKGEMAVVWIPARHHGRPLPEPEFIVGEFWRGGELGERVREIAEECLFRRGVQLFIFVPTIELAREVAYALSASLASPADPANPGSGASDGYSGYSGYPGRGGFLPDMLVDYSHSRDPARDKKVRLFREGKLRAFVTTTIMERGITIPFADVMILFADYEAIFDEAALVQMAGRAGRSGDYPDARVWFFARRETASMRNALEMIREMNTLARKAGYLA